MPGVTAKGGFVAAVAGRIIPENCPDCCASECPSWWHASPCHYTENEGGPCPLSNWQDLYVCSTTLCDGSNEPIENGTVFQLLAGMPCYIVDSQAPLAFEDTNQAVLHVTPGVVTCLEDCSSPLCARPYGYLRADRCDATPSTVYVCASMVFGCRTFGFDGHCYTVAPDSAPFASIPPGGILIDLTNTISYPPFKTCCECRDTDRAFDEDCISSTLVSEQSRSECFSPPRGDREETEEICCCGQAGDRIVRVVALFQRNTYYGAQAGYWQMLQLVPGSVVPGPSDGAGCSYSVQYTDSNGASSTSGESDFFPCGRAEAGFTTIGPAGLCTNYSGGNGYRSSGNEIVECDRYRLESLVKFFASGSLVFTTRTVYEVVAEYPNGKHGCNTGDCDQSTTPSTGVIDDFL